MRDEYRLIVSAPTVGDTCACDGMPASRPRPRSRQPALEGSWALCHVVDETSGETVGMGRLIGDGGCYFHVVDMAVLPHHQRRGIGDAILYALVTAISDAAPTEAFVNPLADAPGRRLDERHGFVPTAPKSIGMSLKL